MGDEWVAQAKSIAVQRKVRRIVEYMYVCVCVSAENLICILGVTMANITVLSAVWLIIQKTKPSEVISKSVFVNKIIILLFLFVNPNASS